MTAYVKEHGNYTQPKTLETFIFKAECNKNIDGITKNLVSENCAKVTKDKGHLKPKEKFIKIQ